MMKGIPLLIEILISAEEARQELEGKAPFSTRIDNLTELKSLAISDQLLIDKQKKLIDLMDDQLVTLKRHLEYTQHLVEVKQKRIDSLIGVES